MKSLFATYLLRDALRDIHNSDGADFSKHYYVPEIDPVTHETYYDMADHGHLLKRVAGTK